MAFNLFFLKQQSEGQTDQRNISARRIRGRRYKVSKWATLAQRCEEEIDIIDKKLSKLTGPFIRAQKERLEARKLQLQGNLDIYLQHMEKEKSLLSKNVKHNQDLSKKRLL